MLHKEQREFDSPIIENMSLLTMSYRYLGMHWQLDIILNNQKPEEYLLQKHIIIGERNL